MHKPQSPVCFTICSETIKMYSFNSHRYSTFSILSRLVSPTLLAPRPASVWLLVAVDVLFPRGWRMKLTSSFHIFPLCPMSSVMVRRVEFPCWLIITECMIVCKTTLSWNPRGWWCKSAQSGCYIIYVDKCGGRQLLSLRATSILLLVIITFLYQDLWDDCLMNSLGNQIFWKLELRSRV